jgi:hypothetical protein
MIGFRGYDGKLQGLGLSVFDDLTPDYMVQAINAGPLNPGTAFENQCRTESNPDGWVVGSGGYTSPPPVSPQWYALSLAEKQGQLQHAKDLQLQGFSCPTTAAQGATDIAASPFFNATPFTGVNNTPLVPGWNGGLLPPGTAVVGGQVVNVNTGAPVAPAAGGGGGGGSTPPVVSAGTLPADGSLFPAGFSLGSIPWWGWAVGAGALLFVFGGKK